MQFEDILPQLRTGIAGRRSGLSSFNWVRLVVPQEERGVDGPVSVWRIFYEKNLLSHLGCHENEQDAKAALSDVRKSHTQKWNDYHKAKAKFDEEAADPDKDTHLLSPSAPIQRKDFYKACVIRERPASHRNRLSQPYFIAALTDGSIVPWHPTSTDITGQDWSVA